MIVGYDPGHGGRNTGARHNDIIEKDFNLALCHYMHARNDHTMDVASVMTRSDDEEVSLAERGRRADHMSVDLLISIHVNAHWDRGMKGAMVFYRPHCLVSHLAADAIINAMPGPLRRRRNKIFPALNLPDDDSDDWLERPARVLSPHKDRPSVLLEVGYCSNSTDAALLGDPRIQYGIAIACDLGIATARIAELAI